MQLPRGTFREIRKSVTIESLIHSLEGEKYTGLATISSHSLSGTLVFKQGKFILIKFQNIRGDPALGELQKAGSEVVDAALSVLGDAQIELALEFNKPCRLTRSGKPVSPVSPRPAMHGTRDPPRAVPERRPAIINSAAKPAGIPVHPPPHHDHSPAPHPPVRVSAAGTPAPASGGGAEEPVQEPDTSFEDDLETFENMDLDSVTDKIRTDCKSMIKQLHLDHLMER